MKRTPSALWGFALTLALSACATPGTGRTARPAPAVATLEVANNGRLAVDIFAVHGGNRHWLGRVLGSETRTIRVPGHLLEESFQFVASTTDMRSTQMSEELVLIPGRPMRWTLFSPDDGSISPTSVPFYSMTPAVGVAGGEIFYTSGAEESDR